MSEDLITGPLEAMRLSSSFSSTKIKLDELFLLFVTSQEGTASVRGILDSLGDGAGSSSGTASRHHNYHNYHHHHHHLHHHNGARLTTRGDGSSSSGAGATTFTTGSAGELASSSLLAHGKERKKTKGGLDDCPAGNSLNAISALQSLSASALGGPGLGAHSSGLGSGLGLGLGFGLGGGAMGGHGGMGLLGLGGGLGAASGALGDAPPRSPTKKSPKKRTQAEMQSSRPALEPGHPDPSHSPAPPREGPETHSAARRKSSLDTVPTFFTPGQCNLTRNRKTFYNPDDDSLANRMSEINEYFKIYPQGIPIDKFVHITKRLVGIPSFFNAPLVRRINALFGDARGRGAAAGGGSGSAVGGGGGGGAAGGVGAAGAAGAGPPEVITLPTFLAFWQQEVAPFDRVSRFFRCIKQPEAECIDKDDFVPFLRELLHFHPGLEFLEGTDEFQRKYALSVIARIFYSVNTSGSGRLSLREVLNSGLFGAFMHVDEENDINRVPEFFSYEHFYVLYCRFFELDTDRDGSLSRGDLVRYAEHALSEQIVDRVFHVGRRAFTDGHEGWGGEEAAASSSSSISLGGAAAAAAAGGPGMCFADFVFFMLSEEDKTSEASLRYWFRCCDLDGDGVLSVEELRHFYKGQLHRLTSLGQDAVPFSDVLCQLADLLEPKDPQRITLADLLRPAKKHQSGLLFDVVFNLHKFLKFEARDPFQEKQRREDGFACDWDRFACIDYQRLAQEEGKYEGEMEIEPGAEGYYAHHQGQGQWMVEDDEDDDDEGVGQVYLGRGGAQNISLGRR